MAKSAGYKNPLSISPFWQKASTEPLLEWPNFPAMMEMDFLAKDGMQKRSLLRPKPPTIDPTEPIYEFENNGEAEAEKRKRDVQNQEKNVNSANKQQKSERERSTLHQFPVGRNRCQGEKLYTLVFNTSHIINS